MKNNPSIEELIAAGYGRHMTVGAFSTGIAGGVLAAVIDIDHPTLADFVFPLLDTRAVRTIRKRGHIYVQEYLPSKSTTFDVLWEGKPVAIELKCAGAQVAAPPTPGYILVNKSLPMLVNRVEDVWQLLAKQIPSLKTITRLKVAATLP